MSLNPAVEQVRIELLFKQSRVTQTAGLLNAGIFIFISKDFVSVTPLLIWGSCVLLIYIARMELQRWFTRHNKEKEHSFNSTLWENAFLFGSFLSGCTWGVAGFFLPPGLIAYQAFFAFLLAGTTAGAAVAYSSSNKAVQLFLLSSVLPFAARLSFEGGRLQYEMATMLLLYVILFSGLMRRMGRYVTDSISLRFEKDQIFKELIDAQSKMTHSTKMAALGEMAAGISHEISNPLMILRGNVQYIRELAESNKLDQRGILLFAEKIDTTTDRITKIISGLKSFAREGKNDPFDLSSVKKIVLETLDFCQNRFKAHGVNLIVNDIPNDLKLFCRDVQISQLLLNLLNNSFDAVDGRPGAVVKIEVQEEAGHVTLGVTDNGPGIPENIREKIMQPFFTTKDVGKGTGLGLSVSKGIAESHGGKFYLDTLSEFTRFVAILPCATRMPSRSAR
ncbi:MAG: Sensory box histidine kinase [Bacteriovoracaceae bacterium]|nr:Sensory box histidine kinase [Bacteriovoracaceae bacterium]